MACPKLDDVIEKFNSFSEKPVKFLAVQNDVKDDIKSLVKSLYDFTKTQEKDVKKPKKGALPDLIVQDLDEEQIWQEIELQNNECWDQLVWEVANCMTLKNDLVFPVNSESSPAESAKQTEEDDDDDDDAIAPEQDENEDFIAPDQDEHDDEDCEASEDNPSDEEILADEEEFKKPKKKIQKPNEKVKPSIVDDQFFKLQEMEQFLLKEEKSEGSNKKKVSEDSDEESIDLFEDIDDDDDEDGDGDEENEGGNDVMYSDFFEQDNSHENVDHQYDGDDNSENEMDEDIENDYEDEQPSKNDKKVRFAQPSSSDDDSDDNEVVTEKPVNEKKSDFELRQERLKQTIDRLEKKTMNEAPWQLKGEVDGTKRPQNSLLEEVVDFDLTTRPAPIITEETTITLEDIIKQRIKDKAWDDVIKKEKPVDDQLKFRKTEILDQSKSKQSLAEVYEAEYLKQKQALTGDIQDEKEPESHTQIRESMSQLFSKLDALCHYHYTPKPAQAEVKIVSNTPAISMEEVAPVAISDAALLAPEEVKKKHRGDLMSKEERTQTDKNRERRKKKKLQKAKGPISKVTEHRNTTKGTEANDKSLKTSKAFFQQLNDDAASLIKNSKNKNGNKKG
ncbi:U3 small nucleolar ribonucleoprotein MPP10 [Operophtera brumata]|uniref:U3 small nucleolar ribonucleoprotein protein MPP10 n=1 Tax=Operophtera brumata TaxID=104452 RepID=A0A0L7LPY8_OPEBR|nr:U3 small nucleolar ribonucleoprotein MPP10 [Operophtera brumata]